MSRVITISVFIVFCSIQVYGQVPTADFNLPNEVCLEEQFELVNTSANATSYEWHFCNSVLNIEPFSVQNINNSGNARSFAFDIAQDTSVLVFFASGSLRKASFANNIDSSIVNLVAIAGSSGSFSSPNDIRVFKEDNNWVGFTANTNGSNGMSRLFFGSEIASSLNSFDFIEGASPITNKSSVTVVNSASEKALLAGGSSSNQLDIVLFDNGFTNDATSQYNYPITGLTKLSGLTKSKSNDGWIFYAASDSDDKIVQIQFENGYENPPTVQELNITSYIYDNPYKIRFIENRGSLFLLVLNYEGAIDIIEQTETGWEFVRSLATASSNLVTLTKKVLDNKPLLFGTSIQTATAGVYRVNFEDSCPASPASSSLANPSVKYSSSGIQTISLIAYNADGRNINSKTINVTSSQAPVGNIMLNSFYCITDAILFNFNTSDDINTYNWDFGDGNTSANNTPTYQYSNEGEYIVSLAVESVAGCPNIFYDTLTILPEPQPGFSTINPEYCTFESIAFSNTTPFDFGENVTWSWDFNGEGSSNEKSPNFTFESPGTKTITLEADVLGCVQTFQSSLDIIEGPEPDFSYDSNCLEESIQFNNLSTGTNITNYLWDFGNGETSIEENPQITFSNSGSYVVGLTVSNSNGCENTVTKNIQVFDEVVDSIVSTEAIENLAFDLGIDWRNDFDSTQNLSYQWELNGESQSFDTVSYTLMQGIYTVNLAITTENNCFFNAQRLIEVKASDKPTADFNLPNEVCLEEQFELVNTSANATSYEWHFCNSVLNIEPFSVQNINNSGNARSFAFDIAQDTSVLVFFASGSLRKASFANNIDSSIVDLVAIAGSSGSFSSPNDIRVIKEGNNWVGFTANTSGSNGMSRLFFGSEIASSLNSFDFIEGATPITNKSSVTVVNSASEKALLAGGSSSNQLDIVLFDNGFTNDATSQYNYPITGLTKLSGLTKSKSNDGWIFYAASDSDDKIVQIQFENGYENPPTVQELNITSYIYDNPYKIRIIENRGSLFLLVLNYEGAIDIIEQTETGWEFVRSLATASSKLVTLTKKVLDNKPLLFGTSIQTATAGVYRVNFEDSCPASPASSSLANPSVKYSSSGVKLVSLTATHPNGSQTSITKEITVTNNVAPEISINSVLEACIGNTISFEGTSPEVINNWKWHFANGDSAAIQNPSYAFENAGTYQVIVEGLSANGCSNLALQELTIYSPPIVSFNKSTQGTICSQKPIDFLNTTNLPTNASFSWDFGDGNFSTEENPSHTFSNAGEYIITLNIDMAGCISSKVDTVQVNPGPEVAFQTTDMCFGQIISFSNNSSGDFITGYQWDFGDGTTSSLINPSHQFDLPGEKNIFLTAYTSNGCTYTVERIIEVFPVATVDFEAEPACNNSEVQFSELVSLQNANVSNYFWDFGLSGSSADISSDANPSFTYPNAGTYEVRLEVTTEDGCVSSNAKQIIVNEVPNPTITYQSNCIGESFQFSGNPNSNITNEFWQLTDEENNILAASTSSTFNYSFLESGVFSVSYRQQTAQFCSKTVTKVIEVVERPTAAFTFDNACLGDEVSFENTSVLNGNTASEYDWFINNQLVSNLPELDYQFQNAGTYEVRLQLTTTNSCMATFTDAITISEIPTPDFELEQQIGAAPFTLNTFTELEAGEIANWYINGEFVSDDALLNTTLDSVGIYQIALELSNEYGCTQKINRQIDVRKPILNISANRLQAVKRADYTEFILTLVNNGSLVPDYYNINFSLGNYAISERLDAIILPGTSVNERLSIQLSTEQLTGVDRVCVEIEPIISPYEELNIADNRVCVGVSSTFSVMNIFPNPSANNVTIPLILPKASKVEIVVEQSNGQTAVKQNYSELSAGYNELTLKRNGLEAGIYILRIRYEGQEKIKKIVFY